MKSYPYVYRGVNRITGEFYIGYREANTLPAIIDLMSYKTSSKEVRENFDAFDWEIIAEFFDGKSAFDFETQLIRECWDSPLILNKHVRDRFRNNRSLRYH